MQIQIIFLKLLSGTAWNGVDQKYVELHSFKAKYIPSLSLYIFVVRLCMQHVKTSGLNLGGSDLVFMKTDSIFMIILKDGANSSKALGPRNRQRGLPDC